MIKIQFPENKKFAFTIFDDTDNSTIENTKPIYDLLADLNIFTTKTVFPLLPEEKADNKVRTQTLQHHDYLNFIRELSQKGFEIAFHNSSEYSNNRTRTLQGLAFFKNQLGFHPTSFANHNNNLENLYWGNHRLNNHLLKLLMGLKRSSKNFSLGHVNNSEYFWGDECQGKIKYVRNFVYNTINILSINPTLPYQDPQKPYVRYWFSACNGNNAKNFNNLISLKNQNKLEAENGVCIIYTHFANGFVKNSTVNKETSQLLHQLSRRNGWFVPVTTLLDHLKSLNETSRLSFLERTRMEFIWAFNKLLNGTT